MKYRILLHLISVYLHFCLYKTIYQSPLMLTELFQHDLINFSYLTACYLYQVMMTLHFFNDVAYDAESTQTSKLRHNRFEESSTMGKLINRIPGSRLLISSLPGSFSKPCLVNLISKDTHLVFSISRDRNTSYSSTFVLRSFKVQSVQ